MRKKSIPYRETSVSVERSQNRINELLYNYEIKRIAWASEKDTFLMLRFVIPKNNNNGIPVKIKLTLLQDKKGKLLPEATYRMLYYYVKSKLEAVKYGMESIEESFMANIMVDSSRQFKDIAFQQLPKFDQKLLEEEGE
jgi:hypothetical protein